MSSEPITNKEFDDYVKKHPIEELGASTDMPEATSSVTYNLVSKDGYPLLFTVRRRI